MQRQLSGHEAAHLYSDTTHSNANVSLLHIYDQSTAPGGTVRFKSILAHVGARLDRAPLFRQRLERVPLGLDLPYWIEDDQFDLEYHVRHIALPKPGDWRQFCIQASRIHARALDLNRPLWELYVIEGLDSFLDLPEGSFAVLFKTHQAAIDVTQAAELTQLLHDIEPLPAAAPPPPPWFAEPGPGRLHMLGKGVVHTVSSPLRLALPLARAVRQAAPAALGLAGDRLLGRDDTPTTRFNSVVSPHRVFDTRRFMQSEFDEIRALVPGATLNDVVLAICGGALRRYLDAQAELPETSLSAIAPRSIGNEARPPADEKVDWLHVPLGTHIADATDRLAAVHEHTRHADKVAKAAGSHALAELADRASSMTLSVARKAVVRVAAGLSRHAPLAHCRVMQVRGPERPLYLCGARMTYFSAILPIADGLGLAFAVTEYDGRIVVSPTSCRELVPDPEAFAQALRDSFQEYLALARKAAKPTPSRSAAKPAPSRSAAKPARALNAVRPTRARQRASGTASR